MAKKLVNPCRKCEKRETIGALALCFNCACAIATKKLPRHATYKLYGDPKYRLPKEAI